MLRSILIACGRLLALAVLLIAALLIGIVIGAQGSVEKQQIIEEAQQAKRWIEQEVKEELLRLQKAKQWIEQEPQAVQEQQQEKRQP